MTERFELPDFDNMSEFLFPVNLYVTARFTEQARGDAGVHSMQLCICNCLARRRKHNIKPKAKPSARPTSQDVQNS